MRRYRSTSIAGVIVLAILLSGFSCSSSTKKLAVASDAIAHALANAQTAAVQAQQQGIITQADLNEFNGYLSKTAQAGLILNQSIRQGDSAKTVSEKTAAFLDAFNALQNAGLAGIKNPNTKLAISTILTGAQTSVAIIVATVGGK